MSVTNDYTQKLAGFLRYNIVRQMLLLSLVGYSPSGSMMPLNIDLNKIKSANNFKITPCISLPIDNRLIMHSLFAP